MGFSIERFAELRPFAYHTCGHENFNAIRLQRELRSARTILAGTNYEHLLVERRKSSVALNINGEVIVISDNQPLRPGSIQLQCGWSLSDYLEELNSRIFLWPGKEDGPINRGRAHFERYSSEGLVFVIRVPTLSLVAANKDCNLWVSRCNSGAARHIAGKPVQRGPLTFQLASDAPFPPSKVIELSFRDRAKLPPETQWANSLSGSWNML